MDIIFHLIEVFFILWIWYKIIGFTDTKQDISKIEKVEKSIEEKIQNINSCPLILWETLRRDLDGKTWTHEGWVEEDTPAYHRAYNTSGLALRKEKSNIIIEGIQ